MSFQSYQIPPYLQTLIERNVKNIVIFSVGNTTFICFPLNQESKIIKLCLDFFIYIFYINSI